MKEGPLKHLTPVQVQDLSSGTSQTVMWEVKVRGNDIVVPMTKLMLESFMSLTPLQDAARIIRKDLGILIVHGREDQQIPWCDAEALYKALIIPKKQLTLMAKAGHAYIGCLDELLEVIIKFIRVN